MAQSRRQKIESAIVKATAKGDTEAVARLNEALAAEPPEAPSAPLRGKRAPQKSAREVLKVAPGADLEAQGYDDEERADPDGVAVPQALAPAFRVQYKEYLDGANKINRVGRLAAELASKLQKLDEATAGGDFSGQDAMLIGKPPVGAIPGVGGVAASVAGAAEDAASAPFVGGAVGLVTRPLASLLRRTTPEGQEIRQLISDIQLLAANADLKGTGTISNFERDLAANAKGMNINDAQADRNIRIGVRRILQNSARAMAELQHSYPDVAQYTRSLGLESARLPEDAGSAYDPESVYRR